MRIDMGSVFEMITADDQAKTEGAIYLWEHFMTPLMTQSLDFSVIDCAKFTYDDYEVFCSAALRRQRDRDNQNRFFYRVTDIKTQVTGSVVFV